MKRKHITHLLAVLPLLALGMPYLASAQDEAAVTSTTQNGETPWGIPIYDVPADADVRFGVLENGMKYAILRNETPEDTAVVRFGFDVGWIDERDNELGLAHLVEHMAFNGSTNIPEGEMVKLLERLGLAFGADTNASTGFEDTIYKLDLPRVDEELVDTALMLMRETASELTITDEAVDRERGIIQSETRTRNNFTIRRFKDYFKFVSPDTLYAQRFRADGTVENIDAAPGSVVRDLYRRYYRPDNATLVFVGDIDPDEIEAKIVERFASWQAPEQPIERVKKGLIDLERGPAAGNFVDPDVQYYVTIDRFAPYREREATIAQLRQDYLVDLGNRMLNRRLQKIANSEDAPIISGAVSSSDYFDIYRQASIRMQAKEGEWEQALTTGEQEWRRAVEHGFTVSELAEQMANLEKRLSDAASQQGTRSNRALAEGILSTARAERLFVKPSTLLEVFKLIKPELTLEAINAAFARHYRLSDPLIHVSTKEEIADAESTILAAYDTSSKIAVAAPEDTGAIEFAYTDQGEPSAIVMDETIEDLGIRTIRFANNVRLNLKPTDFEDDRLRFSIRMGSGQLAFPTGNISEALLLSNLSAQGGLGQHSFDELRQIFAGRSLRYGFSVDDDQFTMSGAITMADLPAQMQLSAAFVTDPGLRPEMISQWRAVVPPFMAQLDATPQAVAQFAVSRIVTGGNLRFGIPTQEELESVDAERARRLIAEQFASAPIEIAVVGEFDEQGVIDAVAATFGALPDRAEALSEFTDRREAAFSDDRSERVLYHEGAPDQALVLAYWPTTDDDDPQEEATLQLLARIMRLEMLEIIREELGASYSPGARSSMSDIYEDYGTFSTSVIVEPSQAEQVFGVIDEIAESLRSGQIDDDLLDRARKPLLEQIIQQRKNNGYWLGVADAAQLEADRLERVRSIEARYKGVTVEMLQAAAQRYLDPAQALRIRVVHSSLAEKE
ncbi:M16 family metallopeptidase [Qipengyuania vesicularis]|uniref:M16 family metallopeptidase n=1 Tax=Qipengyuania vesicularis TaxID=2867232 RepID=UPI001C88D537|nr:M16 family metallopeptidase [Qipengyuania vesicularis]MBX7526247.1 insulinase family protein [Qipengyuania vesicularis]